MEHIKDGYVWVVDLDLRKFFDTVNHSKLIQLLSKGIKDGRVISLIHKFLRAPISENGKVGKKTEIGTPQGGVISPVLANVILHELDIKLVEKGIRACRYADDAMLFCKSRRAAERVLKWVKRFIEKKLLLQINETKTKILKVGNPEVQFLGFSFTSKVSQKKRNKFPQYKYFPVVHLKKRRKFERTVKQILDRRAIGGVEKVKKKLWLFIKGWVNYFKRAIPPGWMRETDEWIRRRIRQLLWKQWKKPRKRHEEFKRRWKNAPDLGQGVYSSNRYWVIAASKQTHRALRNKTLWDEGWLDLGRASATA